MYSEGIYNWFKFLVMMESVKIRCYLFQKYSQIDICMRVEMGKIKRAKMQAVNLKEVLRNNSQVDWASKKQRLSTLYHQLSHLNEIEIKENTNIYIY